MSHDLYVIGGRQRKPRSLTSNEHWYEYDCGLLLGVDSKAERVETLLEYVSEPDTNVAEEPQVLFKSATRVGDTLYACTQTEVMTFALPSLERKTHISLPSFNDVHHVRPLPNGNMLVAISGLDMCMELAHDGTVVTEWGTNPGDRTAWDRFDKNVDYRMGVSTKPHASHPNHVFLLGDEPWATRFQQKDAVSLVDPSRRIEIGLERIHDGVPHGGKIYFTTVDGKVVIADPEKLVVERVIDLTEFHDDSAILGWCRGIYFAPDGATWIGFSRIRATKFRENIGWIARKGKSFKPTHIARYDLAAGRCEQEIDLEPAGLSAVFSILTAG